MLCLAWSPDARCLCHGNQDSTVHFWVVATGRDLQMSGYPLKVAQIARNRFSKYLATTCSPEITVWACSGKGPAGRKPLTLVYHRLPINAMRYQKDGPLLASGCAEGLVTVWRPNKRKQPCMTAALDAPVIDIAWPTGTTRLFGACEDGRVVAFDVGTGDQ